MLGFNSCDDDEPEQMIEELTTVVDIAAGNDNFSSLVAALTKVNLVSTLKGSGPFTVFAPTNDAFAEALTVLGFSELSDVPNDVLTDILLYHVVSGKVESTDLSTGYITTLNSTGPGNDSPSLLVDVSSGVKLNGNTSVTTADLEADNGVVHVIDKVLLPPDVTDIAIDNANYSILVEALTKANLVNTLKGEGPFTVLAPDNDAFERLLTLLGANDLDDIPVDVLTNVLLNHVISGNIKSTDLSTGYANTLAAGVGETKASIYVNTDNGVNFNGGSDVVLADIGATNGTVHAVKEVILVPDVVDFALADPNFSSLVTALTVNGLMNDFVSVLSGDGPFTVFAPTNSAFDALLMSNDDWTTLTDIPLETLEAVLKYHVVSGANVQSGDLTDEMPVIALEGSFTIDLDNGTQIKTSSDQTVNIVTTDVQASNGVIHAIDAVLLP